jgi:hypothetical protein
MRRTGFFFEGAGVFSLLFFAAAGLAAGGRTVAVISRSSRRYVATADATCAGVTARICAA